MKQYLLHVCAVLWGALIVLLSSWSAYADTQVWVVGEDGRLQPIERHFFDLHDQEAAVQSTGSTQTTSTTQTTTVGAELTEQDKEYLVTEEESAQIEKEQDLTIAAAETAIKEKVVEKYKIQIDSIIERLLTRIADIPAEQQNIILQNMRDKVASKKPAVIESQQIDTLRKETLLEILDYIISSLEPSNIPSSTTETTAQ